MIRGYAHPLVFVIFYKIIQLMVSSPQLQIASYWLSWWQNLDSRWVVAYGPRLLQVYKLPMFQAALILFAGNGRSNYRLLCLSVRVQILWSYDSKMDTFLPLELLVHLLYSCSNVLQLYGDIIYDDGAELLAMEFPNGSYNTSSSRFRTEVLMFVVQ